MKLRRWSLSTGVTTASPNTKPSHGSDLRFLAEAMPRRKRSSGVISKSADTIVLTVLVTHLFGMRTSTVI